MATRPRIRPATPCHRPFNGRVVAGEEFAIAIPSTPASRSPSPSTFPSPASSRPSTSHARQRRASLLERRIEHRRRVKTPYVHFARSRTWTSSRDAPPTRKIKWRPSERLTTDGRDGWDINYGGGGALETNRKDQYAARHQGLPKGFEIAKEIVAPEASQAHKAFVKKERAFWKESALGSTWDFKFAREDLAHKASVTAVACSPVLPKQDSQSRRASKSIQKKARRRRRGSVARTRRASVARSRRSSVSTTKSLLEEIRPQIGQVCATGDEDALIKIWDAGSSRDLWNNTDDLDPDTQAQLKKLDWRTRDCLRVLRGHTAAITGLAFSPDGRTLLSASRDKTVRCWEVATGECVEIVRGHTAWVTALDLSLDGSFS